MAHSNASRAVSVPPMIAVEDFEFPVSGIRSSLAITSPPPVPKVLSFAPISHYHGDNDDCDLPSLSASGSRKRKRTPRRPKTVETRRLRIRIPGRVQRATTQLTTSVKIRIPVQKAANDRLRPSSLINIALPRGPLSATSPIVPQDLDDPPQKLKITIPPTTKLSKAEKPPLLVDTQTPTASASQEFPVSFKIKIHPLIQLPHGDQNAHPGVSGPNDTDPPSRTSPSRPRRIAPLPKRYMQAEPLMQR